MRNMKLAAAIGCAGVLGLASIAAAEGTQIEIDISGIQNWDLVSSANNHVMVVDLAAELGFDPGTEIEVTGIGWDVLLETEGASWFSEAGIYIDDNINPDQLGLFLRPGAADNEGGDTPRAYSSNGVLKLEDLGIANVILPDGSLRLEFYESFDDVMDAVDSTWVEGTLVIQAVAVPAPGALALLGAAGFISRRRRR